MSFWENPTYAEFWLEIARGDLATWIQLTPYVYAVFEGIHLVGVAFFFGSIFLLDLRLLGLMPQLLAAPAGRFLLRIAGPAFVLLAVSGTLLFVPSADRYAASPVFFLKLGAIAAGGLNALAFHLAAWRRVDAWSRRRGRRGRTWRRHRIRRRVGRRDRARPRNGLRKPSAAGGRPRAFLRSTSEVSLSRSRVLPTLHGFRERERLRHRARRRCSSAGQHRRRRDGLEADVRVRLLGSLCRAFLVFGLALVELRELALTLGVGLEVLFGHSAPKLRMATWEAQTSRLQGSREMDK